MHQIKQNCPTKCECSLRIKVVSLLPEGIPDENALGWRTPITAARELSPSLSGLGVVETAVYIVSI